MRYNLAIIGLAMLLLACPTADNDGLGRVCRPSESVLCFCRDGTAGTQDCRSDGEGYEPCDCAFRRTDGGITDSEEPETGTDTETDADDVAEEAEERDSDGSSQDSSNPDESREDVDTGPDEDGPDEDGSDTPTVMLALGEDCEADNECTSGICLGVQVSGSPEHICAKPCCHEEECNYGFGCLQLGAGRYCMPARLFPPTYTFTQPTGEPCASAPNACKSGICDSSSDYCRGTCCTDRDCGVAPCHWSQTGSTLRTFCDPVRIASGDLRTGATCYSEYDCRSGICVDAGGGAFQCADLCCSDSQCSAITRCGLVSGIGEAVVRACVPLPRGDIGDGMECVEDSDCDSGNCIESACRRICCLDSDCTLGQRCLPRVSREGVLTPVCIDG